MSSNGSLSFNTCILETKEGSIIEISVKYIVYTQFIAASVLLNNKVSIEEWMMATTSVK